MSAWTVSAAHIDALINSALEHQLFEGTWTLDDLSNFGKELWRENYKSVNYRYDEDTPVPDYRFTGTEKPLDPLVVLAAAHSYDYQSCEHPGWESSLAYAWLTKLIAALEADPRVTSPSAWIYESGDYATSPSGIGWSVRSLESIPAAASLLA